MAPLTASSESKPEDKAAITLESWSQGFMMGALVIMIGMTLANMRRRNPLHKLILLEVSISNERFRHLDLQSALAFSRTAQLYLYLLQSSCMGMVSVVDRHPPYHFVDSPQHYFLDEEQAVLARARSPGLPLHRHYCPTLLDS